MPRGNGLFGKVSILTWDMRFQQNISGDQLGAYFGYSICVVDINNDGLQDIIVGAPMFTEPNNAKEFEHGQIYVWTQDRNVRIINSFNYCPCLI